VRLGYGSSVGSEHEPGGGAEYAQHPTFSEYFHADTGIGLGAKHQTGWTAMVAHLICTSPPLGDPDAR